MLNRHADRTLTAAAVRGKTLSTNANCASCHGGAGFTASGDGSGMKNIGTLKPSSKEPGPAVPTPPNQPPSTAVNCAAEGGTCKLPAGTTATVYEGARTVWAVRTGVTGSIAASAASRPHCPSGWQ